MRRALFRLGGECMGRWIGWALIGLLGCAPAGEVGEGGATSNASSSGASPDPSPEPTGLSATIGDTTWSTTTTATEDTTGSAFIASSDGGPMYECNPWEQNCPRGEKCMPWAVGEGSWNATRCVPIDDDAKPVGEPCTVVESAVSGIDDCEFGAMCWSVDPETNIGECVAFCRGSEQDPQCPDACDACPVGAADPFNLCFPQCDPIAQDCGPGKACQAVHNTFVCVSDVSGDAGLVGDPCEYVNTCDAGNFCASAEMVPGCETAGGCCAPFCDAAADTCDLLLPGTTCVPWYEDGEQPAACIGTGIIGACTVTP